jgi:predicted nucleic acid-binding protein
MKSILFDSFAILAYAQEEAGADQVERLLRSASSAGTDAYMSEINLGEIYYLTIRRIGLQAAGIHLEQVRQLPIQVVSPTTDLILRASEIKAEYAISYADCFAVATALDRTATIVTGDSEFKKVEHLASIMWIW